MKKIINKLLIFTLLFIFIPKVYALEVSNDKVVVSKGGSEEVELYIETDKKVKSVSFSMFFTTYDIPGYFYVDKGVIDNALDGTKHVLTFEEAQSGKIVLGKIKISAVSNPKDMAGSITLSNATYTDTLGNVVNMNNKIINVTISEEKQKDEFLLKEIKSKIVKIDLVKGVYEYKVQVPADIDKLDLSAVAIDDSYKVEISDQEIDKLKDGKITIKVYNDTNSQDYTIIVDKLKEVEKVKIDDSKFQNKNNYTGKWVLVIIVLSIMFVIGLILGKKQK